MSIFLGLLLGRAALTALFWVCALFAASAAVRFVWFGDRASSPMADPGTLTTLLYLAWIPWTHRQLSETKQQSGYLSFLVGAVGLVFTLAMFATHSRYALLAVFGALTGWWILTFWQKVAWKNLIATTVGVLIAFAIYTLSQDMGGAVNESLAAINGGTEEISDRELIWSSTLNVIAHESGWAGLGLYTFSLVYPQYRSVYEQGTQGIYAHNDFLQMFMEGGLLLLVPLLVLTLFVVVRCVVEGFARGQWRESLGCWGAIACALVHASINFVLYVFPLVILFGLVFGVGCALARENSSAQESDTGRKHKFWWRLSVLPIGVVLAVLALDVVTYAVFSGQKGVPLVKQFVQSPSDAAAYARLASSLNDDRGVPKLALAQYHAAGLVADQDGRGNETRQRTAQYFQEAIATDPWNPLAYFSFARFLNGNGGRKDAIEELLLKAHSLAPQDVSVSDALYSFYLANDRLEASSDVVFSTLRWCDFHTTRNRSGMEYFLTKVESAKRFDAELSDCKALYATPAKVDRTPPLGLQYFLSR